MSDLPFQVLNDGRIYVDYGPVSMVIMASKNGKILTNLCLESFSIIEATLVEISKAIDTLNKYPDQIDITKIKGVPKEMVAAVRRTRESTLTPMATVAGTMSDVVADWLYARGADKVIVNNGGDIALRLDEGQSVRMGIQSKIQSADMETIISISAAEGVGGVCTSGLGGRSFTRGVANAVTICAERCMVADACATQIANASYIESPRVHTILAKESKPDSDIGELSIVTKVDYLTADEINQSIDQVKEECVVQAARGNVKYAFIDIGGKKFQWPEEA